MSLFDNKDRILVSASQITNFQGCHRYWWFNKIKKKPVPFTYALNYGKKFHSCIESSFAFIKENKDTKGLATYLKLEKFPEEVVELILEGWSQKILKLPSKYIVEKNFKIGIEDFGLMRGAIDFYNVDDSRIEDHKTIGSWQYALDKDDLKRNIQLMIYSYYIFNKLPDKKQVTIRHNQFYKSCPSASRFVEDLVNREESFDYWKEHVVSPVKEMVRYSKEEQETSVPCNLKYCSSYGGCPFAKFCSK